jgi:hypothetical protein
VGSETLTFKLQMPGNHPEEIIWQETIISLFQSFAPFWMSYAFFWVIPLCL